MKALKREEIALVSGGDGDMATFMDSCIAGEPVCAVGLLLWAAELFGGGTPTYVDAMGNNY